MIRKECIVETGILQILVASPGDEHSDVQTASKLGCIHELEVFQEACVDVTDEGTVGLFCWLGAGVGKLPVVDVFRARDNRVILRVDELDHLSYHISCQSQARNVTHSINEVTQICQQLIVVCGNEFAPQERRVICFRSL